MNYILLARWIKGGNLMNDKIYNFIKPYVRENKITQKNYQNLFGSFDEEMMDLVYSALEDLEIEIVSELSVENSIFILNKSEKIEMTNEQLCLLYQRGDKFALDALIIKNKRLVYSRIKYYSGIYRHDLSEDDLFQEGCLGIMKAADKFDINIAKFTTYSVNWIDQAIGRAIADTGYTIRVPVHMYEKVNKFRRAIREIEAINISKRQLKKEIIKITGFSYDELEEVLRVAEYILNPTSLNITVGESKDTELIELVEVEDNFDPVDVTIEEELKRDLSNVLDTLTVRESDIIRLRFGLNDGKDRTLEEVGKEYGVTRERIRQIESKSLRKLRHPSRSKKLSPAKNCQ